MSGWVKLHRKITEWGWYTDVPAKVVFLHLLVTVNREEREWLGQMIPAGSGVYGRRALSEQTGLSEKQVRTALEKLEKTGEVGRVRTAKFSIISIANWCDYQEQGQQRANEGPAKGQQSATSKEGEKIRSKEEESTSVDSLDAVAPDDVRQAYDYYQAAVEDYNAQKLSHLPDLPKPTKLTDKRRRELKRALKELPEGKTFADVVTKAGKCPHLMGDNDRGWTVNFDFLIRKGKFQEILDGKYPEKPKGRAGSSSQPVGGGQLFDEMFSEMSN